MVNNEAGYSLVELMIVALITSAVIGAAVTMSNTVQGVYSYQLNDAAVQQEARFILDYITNVIGPAGSNPYDMATTDCPAAGTAFAAIRLDPNADTVNDDIRVQADVNPPNGVVLGTVGNCTETGEDVTISHDPTTNTVMRRDRATDATPVAITDGVVTQLLFTYLTPNRTATAVPDAIAYVQVSLTVRSRSRNLYTGQFPTYTYTSEIRLRAR